MATPRVQDWRELLKFRCTGCGNCCKGTIVMLTDHDVRRLVEGVGVAPRDFIRFFGEDEVQMPRRHPFWIRFENRRAAMGLRWARGRCIFLGPDDRCTVYAHRPVACREHPFNVTLSDTGAVEGLSLSRIVDCPFELDGQVTRRALAAVSRWNESESEDYQGRVREWNRRRTGPRNRAAFMEFLGFDWNRGEKRAGPPSLPVSSFG